MGIVISIIAPLVFVGVILLLIKVADRGAPTREENEKKREEMDEIIKWAKEHPEKSEKIWRESFEQFFPEGIEKFRKKERPKDEQKQ